MCISLTQKNDSADQLFILVQDISVQVYKLINQFPNDDGRPDEAPTLIKKLCHAIALAISE